MNVPPNFAKPFLHSRTVRGAEACAYGADCRRPLATCPID